MTLLAKNSSQSEYLRIENNLIHAALHVYAFKMGLFPQGTLPTLPGEHGETNMYVIYFAYVSTD